MITFILFKPKISVLNFEINLFSSRSRSTALQHVTKPILNTDSLKSFLCLSKQCSDNADFVYDSLSSILNLLRCPLNLVWAAVNVCPKYESSFSTSVFLSEQNVYYEGVWQIRALLLNLACTDKNAGIYGSICLVEAKAIFDTIGASPIHQNLHLKYVI